jgi:hypothetical protein
LDTANNQLWDSLYWTHHLTRPDRLAKAINTVVRKNSTDTEQFLYDNHAAKNIQKLGLTHHDINRFEQLDKLLAQHMHSSLSSGSGKDHSEGKGGLSFFGLFDIGGSGDSSSLFKSEQSKNTKDMTDSMHSKKTDRNHLNVTNIESNNDTQYVLSRANVEKYLSELSDHVHLEGEIILPKPIDVHLVKLSTFRAETKLVSHNVLVRTRSNVHVVPLRCPLKDNSKSAANTAGQYRWLESKFDQLKATVEQLTNQLSLMKNQTAEQATQTEQKCTDKLVEVERKWSSKVDALDSRLTTTQREDTADRERQELKNRVVALERKSTCEYR